MTAQVNWSSDGSIVTITAPSQNATVSLTNASGVEIFIQFTNADADILTFSDNGPTKPSNLELKITSFISNNLAAVGLNPSGFFGAGDYFLELSFSGLTFKDGSDNSFVKAQSNFTLSEDPGVYAYIDDLYVSEGGSAELIVTLSRAATSAVSISYQTSGGTAT